MFYTQSMRPKTFSTKGTRPKAFTLIELLVVIAIIAILAAILFPVFAQAREKARQASCLSNQKQFAIAAMQYVQDFDETYPLGGSYNGTAWHVSLHDTPVDWRLSPPTQSFRDRHGSYWANAIQTYMKSRDVARCPSAEQDFELASVAASYTAASAAGRAIAVNSYTYNGLLHAYPNADVDEAANVIMFSESTGKIAYRGFASTDPSARFLLDSGNPNAIYLPKTATGCATTPSGAGGTGAPVLNRSLGYIKDNTLWVHNGGMNMTFADGHAKWRKLGAQLAPLATDIKVDPYTNYDPKGKPASSYWDGCHYCLFRPKVNPNAISDFCKM